MDNRDKYYVLIMLGLLLALALLCAFGNVQMPPYPAHAAFESPVLTPVRPTPTGWPNAPFSWQTQQKPRLVWSWP